jgi:guanine nucleotide-binding protein G(i) subunit alpha
MKIINQNGYTKDELKSWRIIEYRNLIELAQTLVQAIRNLRLSFDDADNNVNKRCLTKQPNILNTE